MSGIDEAEESVGESEVDPAMIQKLKDAMEAKGADAEEPIGLFKLESQWREKYDNLETELNLTRVSDNACRSMVDNFGEACLKSKTPVECRKNIEKLMQELELLRKAKKNEDSDDEDEDDIEEERLLKELEAERSDAVVSAASLGLEWYVDIPTTTHDTGIPRRVTVTGLGIRIKAMPWLIGKGEKHESRPWLRRIAYYSKQDNSYYLFRGVSKMYDENKGFGFSYWEWKDNFEYVVRALGDSAAAEELQKKYKAMEKEALAKREAMAFYQKYKGRAETCEQDVSSLEAALEERERERLMSLHDRRPYRVPVPVPVPVPFPRFASLGRWSPIYPRGRIHSSFGMLPPRRMVQHELPPKRVRRV